MIDCVKVQTHLLFLIWPQLGPFWILPELFLEFWSGSKTLFRTYLVKQSTLVLEVQFYLFVFDSATIGAFLHFLDPSELILGLESGSKTFFLTILYIDKQLWF